MGGISLLNVIIRADRRVGNFPNELKIESMMPGVEILSAEKGRPRIDENIRKPISGAVITVRGRTT